MMVGVQILNISSLSTFIPSWQILIAIVLLVKWSNNLPPIEKRFQFLDLFAGVGNATKVW